MQLIFRAFLFACACNWLCTEPHAQQLEIKFNLLELPSSRKAQAEFNTPVFATVDQQPVGKCLIELSRSYHVSLWLDRRVDRSRLISYDGKLPTQGEDGSALARLRGIAKLADADAGLIENVLYVGPADQVAEVQRAAVRLHDEISRSARDAKMQVLEWDELTTPTELLSKIQSQWQVEISEAELPHDLMHAGQLPASTLATQLTLLCAGCEMQAVCMDGHTFVMQPLEHQAVWQANYAKKDLQTNRFVSARRDFSGSTATIQGAIATVTGPTDFHLRLLASPRSEPRDVAELKFSIPKINAPLAKILGDLSKQLGMQLEWDRRITESQKDALISFSVPEPQTLDEVLRILANSSGVAIERQSQKIVVQPQ